MQIVFVIKPYSVNMYAYENDVYNLLGIQDLTHIEKESDADYENRMIYVIKDICQDFINTDIYKKNKSCIKNIKVILTNPWCIYEIVNLEKNLENPEKIDQKFLDRLILHKEVENISILKNSIFSLSLNGYNIQKVDNQIANSIHIQYLSIYSSTNFLNRLKNTLETLFHLHDIEIDSIYSHINQKNNDNQLKIIIEDRGFDLSYIYENKNTATLFVKSNYLSIKDKLKESLHVDNNILDKILKSKFTNTLKHKTLDNIWVDLDENIKIKIETVLNQELEIVKKQIRDFIDNIENSLIKKDTHINIFCLEETMLLTFGIMFSDSIKNDAYILAKLLTDENNVFTKKIF